MQKGLQEEILTTVVVVQDTNHNLKSKKQVIHKMLAFLFIYGKVITCSLKSDQFCTGCVGWCMLEKQNRVGE